MIIVVTLCSCSSNDIYYDFSTKSIKSTSGDIIHRLRIEHVQSSYCVMVVKDDNEKGADNINIRIPNKGYHIEDEARSKHSLPLTLSPNSTYIITNISYGDAGICRIKIRTDAASMFIKNGYEPHYNGE